MNELSVIVPCLSFVENLREFIDRLAVYLMDNPSDTDVIVVVNENVPAVGELVTFVNISYPWLKFEVLHRKGGTRSYGALVRFGLAYSLSRYAVIVSPYGEDDISIISQMLAKIRKGAQLVQTTRYAENTYASDIPLKFRLYQYVYRAFVKLFLGFDLSDSTYGYKMLDRVFVQSMGLTHNGNSISPEITFKTLLAGGKVEYISSRYKTSPLNKDFKLYKEGIGFLLLLVRGFAHRIGVLWF